MGGGGWFYVPKVWSPAGGWWNIPANWKGNTAMAGLAVGVMLMGLIKISSDRERRPIPPIRHIPSQYWCKHAAEDDPSLVLAKK
ncbi:hypothetical protein MPSEU_000525000 [Mayamaea pseudoterrestris]|nr:hypothetical protein MPSEU_000525000 [Mayamaea pseudoterrestris]